MLPRVVVRVRRAVRRLARRSGLSGSQGAGNEADNEVEWRQMLPRINERDAGAERRLAEAERALNRLGRR